MGFKSGSEYFSWDLNPAVSIFSVSKVCGGHGHPCRYVFTSRQFFPPTFLLQLVAVMCLCGRELKLDS